MVGVCESGEKGRQEDDDETEGRHGRVFKLRWNDGGGGGVTRQERVCKECDSGEVEDVEHWLMGVKLGNPNE